MNTRRKLIAGNWKMNCLQKDGMALAEIITEKYRELSASKADVLMSPPFTLLHQVHEIVKASGIFLGAQDCHFENSGAHTGDISAEMLEDIGCDYVILGHSERRTNHKETSDLVKKKAEAAIAKGLKVIICIGETEAERDAGKAVEVVNTQLTESLPAGANAANTVIAYEPVWAIGTGKTATLEDIAVMHTGIRARLVQLTSREIAEATRILYGGSVKSSNAKDILSLEHVDGALIGGASLKAEEFWDIAKNVI